MPGAYRAPLAPEAHDVSDAAWNLDDPVDDGAGAGPLDEPPRRAAGRGGPLLRAPPRAYRAAPALAPHRELGGRHGAAEELDEDLDDALLGWYRDGGADSGVPASTVAALAAAAGVGPAAPTGRGPRPLHARPAPPQLRPAARAPPRLAPAPPGADDFDGAAADPATAEAEDAAAELPPPSRRQPPAPRPCEPELPTTTPGLLELLRAALTGVPASAAPRSTPGLPQGARGFEARENFRRELRARPARFAETFRELLAEETETDVNDLQPAALRGYFRTRVAFGRHRLLTRVGHLLAHFWELAETGQAAQL